VRSWFADAGFEELSFVAPAGNVLGVGCHQRVGGELSDGTAGAGTAGAGTAGTVDPELRLFDFVGDGSLPA
jgi:hypothetical protein